MSQCIATTQVGARCRNTTSTETCHIHRTASTAGCVYVLTNASMEGQVKVGWTRGSAEDRARALSTTSVATPFVVAHSSPNSDAPALEKQIHAALAGCRVAANREFFRATVEEAVLAFAQTAPDIVIPPGGAHTVTVPAGTTEVTILFKGLAV